VEHVDLIALADFNLVAKHGGFGRAARAAERPKATLSRRVAELEASLGLRLFERGAHMLKLTEEGRALYERTSALLTELGETAAEIASGGASPRGTLRISVPLLFSQIAMGTLAARFALRYPDVRLDITTEDRQVDMVEEGYDLVIRINPDPDESLVGRVFLRDRLVVVGSPEMGVVPDGKRIPAVTRGSRPGPEQWTLVSSGRERVLEVDPVLGMSSLLMVRDAVHAGVGIARLPLSLVSRDLASGRLKLWGGIGGPETELWLLYPSRRLLSARVPAFLDFFRETFPKGTPEELSALRAF
jgi:DNA-binding transcriptional LysR family regulator